MPITNLPVNPNSADASLGKDYLLYVNTGSVDTPSGHRSVVNVVHL